MFIDPPTRNLSKFADGSGPRPAACKISDDEIKEFVRAYRAVCERDDRTCVDCQREFLYQPHLKLGVIDDTLPIYDEKNLQCLCYPCARKREAGKTGDIVNLTSIVRDAVIEREGRTCVYCLRGPIYGEHADVVPRVQDADTTDPNDWACSCKTCKKDRAGMDHENYGRRCAEKAEELASYLWDTFGQ